MFKSKEIFINQLCRMKNKYLIPLLFSLISLSAFSQEESSDSIDVKQLNEIVIEAPKVIRKVQNYTFVYGKGIFGILILHQKE